MWQIHVDISLRKKHPNTHYNLQIKNLRFYRFSILDRRFK